MKKKLLYSLCLVPVLMVLGRAYGEAYSVENDTDDYLFIAYVRSKPRSSLAKLYDATSYNHDDIVIYAVPPVRAAMIQLEPARKEYNDALWVASSLRNLVADLFSGQLSRRSKAINPSFVHALAIDRKQSGAYIYFTVKGFMSARLRHDALQSPINGVGGRYDLFEAASANSVVDRYRLGDLKGTGLGRVELLYVQRSADSRRYIDEHSK